MPAQVGDDFHDPPLEWMIRAEIGVYRPTRSDTREEEPGVLSRAVVPDTARSICTRLLHVTGRCEARGPIGWTAECGFIQTRSLQHRPHDRYVDRKPPV